MTFPFAAYVSCASGNEINVFQGGAQSGSLEHIQSIGPAESGPGWKGRGLPLAHSRDGKRLYASVIGLKDGVEEDRIDTYAIDPASAKLSFLSSTSVMAQLSHISIDRTGQFLLGASVPANLVVVHPLAPEGHVQVMPSCALPNVIGAHQILTDPSNRFAYVPSLHAHQVYAFRFDERTGGLAPNSPEAVHLQPGAGCRHGAFHPGRRFYYLLNERDGSLIAYRIDLATGQLYEIMRDVHIGDAIEGRPWGAAIAVAPAGDRLYASERRGSTLAVWDIDPGNGLIANRRIIATAENPRGFALTPNGRFLILAALKADCLEVFDLASSNAPQKLSTLSTGSEPGWVEII